METLHSPWIKWRLIFHHWITNLTVGGLYKYTGEIWAIRSSKIQNWPSDQKHGSFKKSPIDRDFIGKNCRFYRLIADFFPSFSIFSARASTRRFFVDFSPIFRRYIGNFADFWPIFPLIDNQCRLSFRCRPISDISPKYRRHFPIFQSMPITNNNSNNKRK